MATNCNSAAVLKIGDVLSFRNDIVHPKNSPSGRCTFVGLEHIQSNTGQRIGSESVLLEELSGRRARFKQGDIVYGYLRPYLNKVWVAEFDGICSVDQYVLKASVGVDLSYLSYYLRSAQFLQSAFVQDSPGQLPRIRSGELTQTPIPVPSLGEQRRIAAILDQADSVRGKQQEALEGLGRLARSIFDQLFGDPALNNFGFPTLVLGALSTVFSDGPFGSNLKSEHYADEGVRVVRLQNIGVGEFIDRDRAYVSEEHFRRLSRHTCRPRDVLIGTLGDPNLRACLQPANLPLALNKADCVQMRCDEAKVLPEFIEAILNHPSTEGMASNKIQGQTRLRISMGRLRELAIPVPPIELQRQFAESAAAIRALKVQLTAHLDDLNALFASLQHRAFRGEL